MIFCILTNVQLRVFHDSFHLWRHILIDILLVYCLFIYNADFPATILPMNFGKCVVVDIFFIL
jgi:hypothetical protein